MGLDMYLEGRTFNWTDWKHPENNPKKDGYEIQGVTLKLGYWRKHPDLHGYIVQKFAAGKDECQDIPLSADNIEQIIQAIKNKQLPHTTGFFFGVSDSGDDKESIEIFEKALAWLEYVPAPRKLEPVPLGDSGFVMTKVEPLTDEQKKAKEARDVVYRASW